MKLDTKKQDVTRSGVETENTAQIKVTAAAFDILSSGIYSDPIMAVIRELSCNAYDSHCEAGRADVPFEIHLPNKLEPWFSIKDFGTGLSDDNIRNMYMTYFDSTKSDSNEFIGAFGLGSKSPFAYADSFQVIGRWNGKMSTYSIFKNEEGVPSIARMQTIATDEHNGLEIKMTVRDSDFYQFKQKTAEILRYFPTKPFVTGASDFEFHKHEVIFKGDNYDLLKSESYRGKFVAVQGNVPYRVEIDELRQNLNQAERYFIHEYDLVGFFDIGKLSVATSREEVRYNDSTVLALTKMVQAARLDFLKKVEKDITVNLKASSKWDAFATLTKLFNNKRTINEIAAGYKFKNKLLTEWMETGGNIKFANPELHKIREFSEGKDRAKQSDIYAGYGKDQLLIKPSSHRFVIFNDIRQRYAVRLNQFIKNKTAELGEQVKVYVIIPRDRKVMNKPASVKERKALAKTMGGVEILTLSQVTTDVTVVGTPRRTGLTFKRFSAGYDARTDRTRPMFLEVGEPTTPSLYLQIDLPTRDCIHNGEKLNWSHRIAKRYIKAMLKTINHAKGTSYTTDDVYGLTTKVIKNVDGTANWNNMFDLFIESTKSLQSVVEYYTRLNVTPSAFGIKDLIGERHFIAMVKNLDPKKSVFRSLVEEAVDSFVAVQAAKDKGFDESLLRVIEQVATRLGTTYKVSKTAFFKSNAFDRYEMFKLFDYGVSVKKNHTDIFERYVNQVDGI